MFGFIKNLVGGALDAVNTVGKGLGGVLHQTGLDALIGPLAKQLGGIPGLGGSMGGLLAMVPELLQGKLDLADAMKIGAMFLPPPASMIASMADLGQLTEAVVGQVGGSVDPSSPGGENLLRLAQNVAFGLAA